MKTRKRRVAALLTLTVAFALVAAACGDDSADTTSAAELTPIKLQLQWVTQAQFAGYFAAVDQGFYADEGLDVTILQGAVDIVPQQVVASGQAEFGLAWVPKALVSNEEGAGLVDIGQVFQRSGTLEVSWADSGITSPSDWEGKKVGTWGFGNEFELTAAIELFDVTVGEIIQQPFDMSLLLNREIDAAEAMTYNEYAQVLEATNPVTGQLYTADDLSVIDFNDIGTAMLQDAVWVNAEWLAQPGNEDIATKFLRASFKGWIFCRDNFDECVQIVLDNGPTLGASHQAWQLNEINKLIWPSPSGIGVMDPLLWAQTVTVATGQGVIQAAPPEGSYRSDLAQEAVASLQAEGLDTTGSGFAPREVTLNPGGE
ncbi:MAG: ABC transporter substrate-binding protein [Actinobacteria bacterium RBG_16_68_21]|nr:MAG: ABC transporter substrate-binding protein [Actinobacteria bacterium RBG_16_68_21]